MPIATTKVEFLSKVRSYIRDSAALNALLDGVETSDAEMELCLDLAVDDFNTSPPLIGTFSAESHPSQSLLLIATVYWILQSAGILQSRNQLEYSSGGITVRSSDKTQLYQSWIAIFMQSYEAKKAALKKTLNAEQAYGGVSSEYVQINFGGNLVFFGMDSVNLVRNGIFI